MQNSLAKKIFAVGLAASTVLMAMAPLAANAASHAAGTNVLSSDGTVYMITTDGQRRPYTSGGAFLAYGFNSFASTVSANADDLALPVGSFIPPQDGSIFCATETKGTDVKGECALITGGQKASFTSAAVFTGLGFSFSNAQSGDSSFLGKTANIDNTTAAHLPGVLVNNNGTVQLVGSSGLLGIPDLATFNSWGYSFANVVPANAADQAKTQSGVMAARVAGQLSPTFTQGDTPGVITGSVSASLASSNPGSSVFITNQGLANLAEFTFSGTGTVTGVALKRIGVSADTSVSNIYLFDGNTRITDGASITSGGAVTFTNSSGIFTVNGSKTISVKADMTATAGETIGMQLTSYTVANGTPITVSISGNQHSIASATLATFSFGAASAIGNTDPGSDINVFQSTVTIGTRDVNFTRLALRQIGSINSVDISNFRLFVDGTQIAQVQNLDSNGYITFNASKTLASGSRVFKVLADVTGGSGRTVQMSLRGTYDVSVTDSQYGAGIKVTTSSSSFPIGDDGYTVTNGTMTVVRTSDSRSTDVTVGSNDLSLAKYTFTAYGEAVKVETLNVGYIATGTTTGVSVRNTRIMVNGSQVGSTTNVPIATSFAANSGTEFTTNFMVNPGTPATVEIRGDIYDSDSTNDFASGTVTALQALLVGGTGSNNAIPQVSLGTLNVPSQDNVLGNNLTVGTGTMAAAQTASYAAQTVVLPQTNYKLAAFTLAGNSSEAVNINTFTVVLEAMAVGVASTTGSFSYLDVSDMYIKYGSSQTSVKGALSSATAEWSVNATLAKNESMTIEIYGTLGSSVTAPDQIRANFLATGTTAESATTVYSGAAGAATVVNGQILTSGTGSITASVDASTPDPALIDDSGTVTAVAYNFDAQDDNYTITEINLTVGSTPTMVSNVTIKDGSTTVASKPIGTGTLAFTGLSVPVQANVPKVLTVELQMSTIGVGGGSTGTSAQVVLTSAKANTSAGSSVNITESPSNPAGNVLYAFKAVPTITMLALPTSGLLGGSANQTLAKFTISSGGTGTVGWGKLLFTVSKSIAAGSDTITSATLWNADTGLEVTGGDYISGLGAAAGGTITFVAGGEQQVSGARTYELKGVIAGAVAAGDSVTTAITQPSAHANSAAGFDVVTGGGTYYSPNGVVTALDIRMTAVDSYSAATTTGQTATGTPTIVLSKFKNDLTPTTTTFSYATGAWLGSGWTISGSSVTGFVATSPTDASVVTVSGLPTSTTASTLILTFTKTDNGYAAGTTVAATETDLGLTAAGGIADAASFIWTDRSVASHSLTTADWNNGYLVKTLPSSTWTLSK